MLSKVYDIKPLLYSLPVVVVFILDSTIRCNIQAKLKIIILCKQCAAQGKRILNTPGGTDEATNKPIHEPEPMEVDVVSVVDNEEYDEECQNVEVGGELPEMEEGTVVEEYAEEQSNVDKIGEVEQVFVKDSFKVLL